MFNFIIVMSLHPALAFSKLIESGRTDLALSIVNVLGFFVFTLTAYLVTASPFISVLSIYQSVTKRLNFNIDELASEISYSEDGFSMDVINEVLNLFKTIKVTKEHFSLPMLILVIFGVVGITGGVYLIIDTAMNPMMSSLMKGVYLSIFASFYFCSSLLPIILIYPSEEIKHKVSILKDAVSLMETNEEATHEFQGKTHKETYIRNWMAEKLGGFQGFDMGGFAVLGKPLLGSIVATTLTYLIVLVRFKISEKPQVESLQD